MILNNNNNNTFIVNIRIINSQKIENSGMILKKNISPIINMINNRSHVNDVTVFIIMSIIMTTSVCQIISDHFTISPNQSVDQ